MTGDTTSLNIEDYLDGSETVLKHLDGDILCPLNPVLGLAVRLRCAMDKSEWKTAELVIVSN